MVFRNTYQKNEKVFFSLVTKNSLARNLFLSADRKVAAILLNAALT